MDTRKNSVLEAGDKALAMVGRPPNYISAIFPLKDGVISDHTMTRELILSLIHISGLCQRHCLRLFHPHLLDLRCQGL